MSTWAEVRDRLIAGEMTGLEVTKANTHSRLRTNLVSGQHTPEAIAKAAAHAGEYDLAAEAWTFADQHPHGGIREGDVAEVESPNGPIVGIVTGVHEDAGQVSLRHLEEIRDADGTTWPVGYQSTHPLSAVISFATPAPAEPAPGDLVNTALNNPGPIQIS
jgi:hypothetical protein